MTLSELNLSGRATFTAALGHLFEHSPWVADETWPQRPFHDGAELHAKLCRTMRAATHERQLALIKAHPDLAGRLAQQRALTAESTREQASAGLNSLAVGELAQFQQLNTQYREKFGFPFIICARLNDKSTILAAMRMRLANPAASEFQAALTEIEKIARLRLDDFLRV